MIGRITIEIPPSLNRNYRVISEDSARKVLSKLKILLKEENKIDDDEILGWWADREESVEEIAKVSRRKSNNRRLQKEFRLFFTK